MFSVAFLLDGETSSGAGDQEWLFATITAPPGLDLYAMISSAADWGGTIWIEPNITPDPPLVPAGVSFAMPFDGNLLIGEYKWLTIYIDETDSDVISYFNALPGGELFLSGVAPGSDPSAVPVPPAVWLFGSGLLGLIGMARRKKA